MKLVHSSRCSFCKNSDESLEHLFCHCCFSAAFWKSAVFWLETLQIDFDCEFLSDCDIFYGTTQTMSNGFLLHHIIVGKQIIYHSRLKNYLPTH